MAFLLTFFPLNTSFADATFYAGKTLTLVIGADVGGGYDAAGRLMAHYIGNFIPGRPNVVVENMPAGGSVAAANYLYNAAPRDGTTIGLMQRNILTARLTSPMQAKFDLEKFNWIGSLSHETGLVVAWNTAPVMAATDLFKKELIVGATIGTDTDITARLLNSLIGTKLRIVPGYKGNADVLLAMQRGEVQGIADESWSNLKVTWSDYIRQRKVRLLMQNGLEKSPDLPDVPLALDYVRNKVDRQVMTLYFGQKVIARPVLAPPNLPSDRARLLRQAFDQMAASSDFQAAAKKAKLDISVASGETVGKVVAMIAAPSEAVARRFSEITSIAH